MIVAFSTSSPVASVALLSSEGAVLAHAAREARTQASQACLEMLEELLRDRSLAEATLFLSDLGPGSFTGVKVGLTLAKSFAFALGVSVAGASSFDLIAPDRVVVFPSKRGEFFVRQPGEPPTRTEALPPIPVVGFGPGIEPAVFPDAARFAPLLPNLQPVPPEALLPNYVLEPSISTPKVPYRERSAGA